MTKRCLGRHAFELGWSCWWANKPAPSPALYVCDELYVENMLPLFLFIGRKNLLVGLQSQPQREPSYDKWVKIYYYIHSPSRRGSSATLRLFDGNDKWNKEDPVKAGIHSWDLERSVNPFANMRGRPSPVTQSAIAEYHLIHLTSMHWINILISTVFPSLQSRPMPRLFKYRSKLAW